jgi:hypothetical protein
VHRPPSIWPGPNDQALASGNLALCGQQFWLGPARAARRLTLWINTTTVHLGLDGQHFKLCPPG